MKQVELFAQLQLVTDSSATGRRLARSSLRVRRGAGEVSDKGSINQSIALSWWRADVERLYAAGHRVGVVTA